MTKDQEQICKVLKGLFNLTGFHEHADLKKEDSVIVEFEGELNKVMSVYGFIGLIDCEKSPIQFSIFSRKPVPDKDKPILFQFGNSLNEDTFCDLVNKKMGLGLPFLHAQFITYGRE